MEDISSRIRIARTQKNLSQEKLGELLGTSSQAVSNWEKGKTTPKLSKIKALANILNISTEWLQFGSQSNTYNQNGNYSIRGHNIQGNVNIGELNRYNTHLDKDYGQDATVEGVIKLKSMPLLDIDDAIEGILFPEKMVEKIKNTKERVVSLINAYYETVGIRVSDNGLKKISENKITIGDDAIIEPSIRPRNHDFVVIALDARDDEKRRGILAKLKIELDGKYYLITDDTEAPIPMPIGSVICGVVIKIHKNYIDKDLVMSRHEENYDVWKTEIKS